MWMIIFLHGEGFLRKSRLSIELLSSSLQSLTKLLNAAVCVNQLVSLLLRISASLC